MTTIPKARHRMVRSLQAILAFAIALAAAPTPDATAQLSDAPPVVFVAIGQNGYDNLFGGGAFVSWSTDSLSAAGFDYDSPDGERAARSRASFNGSRMTSDVTASISRSSCCCTWMGISSTNAFEVWVRGYPGVRYNLYATQVGVSTRSISPPDPLPDSPQPSISWQFNGAEPGPIDTSIVEELAVAAGPTREFPQHPGVTYTRARVINAAGGGTMVQGFCSCCGCCAGGSYASSALLDVTTEIECELICEPTWQPVGAFPFSEVRSLAILPNGDLVAGGEFGGSGSGEGSRIVRWDGSAWSPLGAGIGTSHDAVHAIKVMASGHLLAGGKFTRAGASTVSNIARWTGTNWVSIGAGFSGTVRAITVLNDGSMVAAGDFTASGGATVNRIARWYAGYWRPFGNGLNNRVYALAVLPNGDLIAGGSFTTAGDISANHIARWDGVAWHALGTGLNDDVRALAVLPNGDLIAGGSFTMAGDVSASRIARWDGETWSPIGSGVNNIVRALAAHTNGDLIAGGYFTVAGGVAASRVARWDGTAWNSLGSGLGPSTSSYAPVVALATLPEGDLIAGGEFWTANGDSLYLFAGIARCITPQDCDSCAADYNSDREVDILDFLDFIDEFASCELLPAPCGIIGNADINGDTFVDILDFLDFIESFGNGC